MEIDRFLMLVVENWGLCPYGNECQGEVTVERCEKHIYQWLKEKFIEHERGG